MSGVIAALQRRLPRSGPPRGDQDQIVDRDQPGRHAGHQDHDATRGVRVEEPLPRRLRWR